MHKGQIVYAVITGDIVRSARLRDDILANLGPRIGQISKLLEKKYPGVFDFGFTAFRGDSFQALLKQPEKAPEIALRFLIAIKRAFARQKVDARLAIGIGSVSILPETAATEGHGEAYALAGRRLDKLAPVDRLAIAFPKGKGGDDSDVICAFLGSISKYWTSRQLDVVDLAMDDLKQEEIAQRLQIDQAAVARHLNKASWKAVHKAILWLESKIEDCISGSVIGSLESRNDSILS
jgi:DNA-binding NarL/FixJ family response regulator